FLLLHSLLYHSIYLYLIFFYHLTLSLFSFFFFFNDTATTEIYTLSLHDALPISNVHPLTVDAGHQGMLELLYHMQNILAEIAGLDRKSTRLNSSHLGISYAVFCLKKKKKKKITTKK